ncbi:MAG: transposase [Thiohalocapsa sp.]|nr:transposase [Thiohalocapsa sp.]MCF7990932.1 transposase [Thiohalocapsa sp.]
MHLILDNSSTHKTEAVAAWLAKHPRFKLHFAPTSASWLNVVESWFSQLERRALYRGAFTSVKDLRDALHRYLQAHNEQHAKPFRWTKSAATILAAVRKAGESTATKPNQTLGSAIRTKTTAPTISDVPHSCGSSATEIQATIKARCAI